MRNFYVTYFLDHSVVWSLLSPWFYQGYSYPLIVTTPVSTFVVTGMSPLVDSVICTGIAFLWLQIHLTLFSSPPNISTICMAISKHIALYSTTQSKSVSVFICWLVLNIFPGWRLSDPGYYDWVLMYVEGVTNGAIDKIIFIYHLHLCCFINSNILNIGYWIDPYDDRVFPSIVQVRRYRINTLFNLMYYFKI